MVVSWHPRKKKNRKLYLINISDVQNFGQLFLKSFGTFFQQLSNVFENRALRTILGPVWNHVTGKPRLRNNRNIRNLTGQPLIASAIQSKRLQWAGHVARAPAPDNRGIYKALYTSKQWGDGPRTGQGFGGSIMCVGTPHPWVRLGIAVKWKAVVEAAVGLRPCSANGVRVRIRAVYH